MKLLRSDVLKVCLGSPSMQCQTGVRALLLPALVAVGLVLGGCASGPPARFIAPVTQKPVSMPELPPTGLARPSVKRSVQIVQLQHTWAVADEHAGAYSERQPKQEVEAKLTALRIALERALIESGRYDVRPSAKAQVEGAAWAHATETIHVSAELVESDTLTQVRLKISDPEASAAAMEFVGTGAPLVHKNPLFSRASAATQLAHARVGALDFAVRQALRNASAVLGMVPWQTSVLEVEDGKTVLIAGGKGLGLRPGILLSIQTRESTVVPSRGHGSVAVPGRIVGELLIIDNVDDQQRDGVSVGTLVSGSLKGLDMGELVARFCRPSGFFGHDFGHDRECDSKAAALVNFDPALALLSFDTPTRTEGETKKLPYRMPTQQPSPVF